jgi:Domain of Unknown Function (DUF326)
LRGGLQELWDECERHARMHQHYRVCAGACRRCEQACDQRLAAIQ